MEQRIFSVLNKTTKQKELVKAGTKGQVAKFLANNFVIEKASPLDVAEIMTAGGMLHDASAVQEDTPAVPGADASPEAGADETGSENPAVTE